MLKNTPLAPEPAGSAEANPVARLAWHLWYQAGVLVALGVPTMAMAQDLDSFDIDGESQVEHLTTFTDLVVTASVFIEDWVSPMGAVMCAAASIWMLWSRRDYERFGIGIVCAICLGALAPLMNSMQTAFAGP